MIWIDIDMPKNCMCCPFPSVGTDYYYCHCPGVDERAYDFEQAESIPDNCPLHEVNTDTVSRQQARHEKTCEGCKWEGENYRRDECQLCTRNFPDRYAKR